MEKGILYGVGVGPGDPELMTLKALRAIEGCPCIAAPETAGEKTLALSIAEGATDLSGKEILPLRFLMTRDRQAREENHRKLAGLIAERLDRGIDVALLNLGDVSIYSTFSYIMEILEEKGYKVVMIPGVPSFCASAAALGISLTEMDRPLHIIPGGACSLDEALDLPGNKVLMKTGKAMPEVRQALARRGLAEKTKLVQNCGLPNQKICQSLDEAEDDISYFTTIIVRE